MLKELLSLLEARDPTLKYTEKKVKDQLDKVIVELEGSQSGKFTKLAGRYKIIKQQVEDLQEVQNEFNREIKDEALALFDAKDEVLTRVVETISLTITVSKQQAAATTSKVNYENVIVEILKLAPGLEEQIKAVIKACTETKTAEKAKDVALRVALKEDGVNEGVKDWLKALKVKFAALLKSVKIWGKEYDKKIAALKLQVGKK